VYLTIQAAVDAAAAGNALHVATGVYEEAVSVRKDLRILGGYKTNCTEHLTHVYSVLDASAEAGKPALLVSNESSVYLDDFRIRCSDASGVRVKDMSSVALDECSVYSNSATYGGGISLDNRCDAFVTNSLVYGNTATQYGGGVWGSNQNVVVLYGGITDVKRNYAKRGGGVWLYYGHLTQIGSADIASNIADDCGGGIYLKGSDVLISGLGTAVGSAGIGQNIVTNGNGGGIYALNSDIVVSNSATVGHNYASDDGGGVYAISSSISFAGNAVLGSTNPLCGNSAGDCSALRVVGRP
jgi:hypothetical protein